MKSPAVAIDDPRADDVSALLAEHLRFSKLDTPPEDVHALDLDGLLDPAVTFVSLRDGGELLGFGAIKQLDNDHAELKSMHTAAEARGRGVGRAILDHLLAIAADRGVRRVSLETGGMETFAPAREFYAAAGFRPCGPFGDYRSGTTSVFMTLTIDGVQPG